jgi:peroxiredoxin
MSWIWVARIVILGGVAALGLLAVVLFRPGDEAAPEQQASNPTPVLTFVPLSATPRPAITAVIPTAPAGVTLGALDSSVPRIGSPAPDFELFVADLQATVRLSELRGRPVVVNFWASWCGPCRAEMPDIQRAFEAAGDTLHVIGVNEQEPDLVARGFAYNLGVTFPLLLDFEASVGRQYELRGLPATFFIDAEGVIRDVNLGYMSKEVLVTRLRSVGIEVALD